MISFIVAEKSVISKRIPRRPVNGCPIGTFNSINTCFCEDHCIWEACRILNPPQNCLSSINGAKWTWNTVEEAWVAQGKKQVYINQRSDVEDKLNCIKIVKFLFRVHIRPNFYLSNQRKIERFHSDVTCCTDGLTLKSKGILNQH